MDSKYRGGRFGILLDQLKKVDSLIRLNWDCQFSHCRAMLHEYHLRSLRYAHSELAFQSHSVAGSGTFDDKEYYMNWITQPEYIERLQVGTL